MPLRTLILSAALLKALLVPTRAPQVLAAPTRATPAAPEAAKVVAYVPNWIDLAAFAPGIDYARLTHINIAFENPEDDQGTLSFNPQDAILIKRAHRHGVRVLLSIGGGAASTDKAMLARYEALLSDAKRAGFVCKLADALAQHGLDGLDVDLEGPSIGQKYGAFIEELAQVLGPRRKLLTAALSQGYGGDKVPASVFVRFDFVNVMAYDGSGPWEPGRPGPHSSMEFARSNVEYWLGRGLPRSKAVLGVPFYGYGFGEAFRKSEYPYSEIVASHPGAQRHDKAGETIWYNGVPTIQAKARYAREQKLGGVMIWSLDSDASGKNSLLRAIHDGLAAGSKAQPKPRRAQ